MAFSTGTATSFLDFYEKLRDFLTTNATLVADSEEWSVLSGPDTGPLDYDDRLMLQGPGLAGTDEVLVGLQVSYDVGADYYNLGVSGYSTYNPGLPFEDQANRQPPLWMLLANTNMPYWFVANGRRFVAVARIGSVYQSIYCGFILPYHLPTTWAYPLFIGACAATTESDWRYTTTNASHGAFFDPGDNAAAIRLPDGVWTYISNSYEGAGEQYRTTNLTAPWHYFFRPENTRQAIDGTHVLLPGEISVSSPFDACLGAFEGVWYASGFSALPEDIVTVGAVDHVLIPNTFRTGVNEFMALALE